MENVSNYALIRVWKSGGVCSLSLFLLPVCNSPSPGIVTKSKENIFLVPILKISNEKKENNPISVDQMKADSP